MAPPKRKTTGRVTPKGTGSSKTGIDTSTGSMAKEVAHHDSSVARSGRYTPPTAKEFYESPRWIPVLMMVFLALGSLSVISRYVVPSFENTNSPVLIGLVLMLCGLFTATKWR